MTKSHQILADGTAIVHQIPYLLTPRVSGFYLKHLEQILTRSQFGRSLNVTLFPKTGKNLCSFLRASHYVDKVSSSFSLAVMPIRLCWGSTSESFLLYHNEQILKLWIPSRVVFVDTYQTMNNQTVLSSIVVKPTSEEDKERAFEILINMSNPTYGQFYLFNQTAANFFGTLEGGPLPSPRFVSAFCDTEVSLLLRNCFNLTVC